MVQVLLNADADLDSRGGQYYLTLSTRTDAQCSAAYGAGSSSIGANQADSITKLFKSNHTLAYGSVPVPVSAFT